MGLKLPIIMLVVVIIFPLEIFAETSPANNGEIKSTSVAVDSNQKCNAIAEDYPAFKEFLHTGPVPLSKNTARGHARACLDGLSDVVQSVKSDAKDTVQFAKDAAAGIGEFSPRVRALVVDQYDYFFKRSPEDYQKVYETCVRQEACLTKLYFDGRGEYPSQKQLIEMRKFDLNQFAVLMRNAYARMNSTFMQNQTLRDRIENEKFLKWQSSNGSAATEHPDQENWMFWDMIKSSLNDYKGVWQCLKPAIATELFCYHVSLYLGPTAASAALKTPRVARILEGLAWQVRSRKLSSWANRSVENYSVIDGDSKPKVTLASLDHLKRRHFALEGEVENLLSKSPSERKVISAIEAHTSFNPEDAHKITSLYPEGLSNDVLVRALKSPSIVSREVIESGGVRSELSILNVGAGKNRFEVQLRVCRQPTCSAGKGVEPFREGEVSQIFIRCGPGGATLPPPNCLKLRVGSLTPIQASAAATGRNRRIIQSCEEFFSSPIEVDTLNGLVQSKGALLARKSALCN